MSSKVRYKRVIEDMKELSVVTIGYLVIWK